MAKSKKTKSLTEDRDQWRKQALSCARHEKELKSNSSNNLLLGMGIGWLVGKIFRLF